MEDGRMRIKCPLPSYPTSSDEVKRLQYVRIKARYLWRSTVLCSTMADRDDRKGPLVLGAWVRWWCVSPRVSSGCPLEASRVPGASIRVPIRSH